MLFESEHTTQEYTTTYLGFRKSGGKKKIATGPEKIVPIIPFNKTYYLHLASEFKQSS